MPINGQSKVDKTQSETQTHSVLVVYPTSFRFEDCYVTCNTVDAKARNYMKCGTELEISFIEVVKKTHIFVIYQHINRVLTKNIKTSKRIQVVLI